MLTSYQLYIFMQIEQKRRVQALSEPGDWSGLVSPGEMSLSDIKQSISSYHLSK